ncbi:hypothetical protein [Actinoplanes sp. NPDC051851]|uniref:hypothetical protein n=1 Tax=Actinoplanes sp. NPDC051851 TaxID=3154753 RepID=UPI00344634E0
MPVARDIDAAEEWLDQWSASVGARAQDAARLAQRVSDVTARAGNRDESIVVTVASTGAIIDLRLEERVHEVPARELSRRILDVMRTAQHRLNDEISAAVRDTVGRDSAAGQAVTDAYQHRFPPAERSDER